MCDIQKLLQTVLRSLTYTVQQVERLPGQAHQVCLLQMTDGTRLVLKCPPAVGVRLLRHEQRDIESEAKVLHLVNTQARVPAPERIQYNAQGSSTHGCPYLLRSHLPGTPLSHLLPYLSTSERARIDRSLGTYMYYLSTITAPTFGPSHRAFGGTGSSSWREAFLSLLESVLRDAEDMLVSIPYDSIRYYVGAHGAILNEIRRPQLVGLEVGTSCNVLIDERSKRISGLLGFGNVVWGDPAMAEVFAGASESFWEGFGSSSVKSRNEKIRQLL